MPAAGNTGAGHIVGIATIEARLVINLDENMIQPLGITGLLMLRWIGLIALLIVVSMPANAQTDTVEEWRKQIVIRLCAIKRFPPGALGQTGTAKVGFVLDRRGRLVSHWLEESTGSQPLDLESLAIVERAQPFPVPPSELDETPLRISAPFVFAARPAHHLRDSPDIGKIREIFEGEAQVDTRMRSICRGC
jgi:protein TonB